MPAALESITRPAAGDAGAGLVLLHGRGSSEEDMAGLFDALDPDARLACAAPRAPLELPPGGFHWYVVPRPGHPDPETFRAGVDALAAWLEDHAARTGIPLERTVLGGFSQGCVMTWALTLAPGRPLPAGALALSGFMPPVAGFPLDDGRLAGLPVAIAHGTHDAVLPVAMGRAARDRAKAAGAKLLYRETPVGHTVDPRVVRDLRTWLQAATR